MSRFPKHTETFILYEMLAIEEQGYLPEAMLNYLVRLGWSHGDQEIFIASSTSVTLNAFALNS